MLKITVKRSDCELLRGFYFCFHGGRDFLDPEGGPAVWFQACRVPAHASSPAALPETNAQLP